MPFIHPTHTAPKTPERFDVVIVGAGISGIGCASMLREQHPQLSFVILEALESYGGTWLIHKYPGTRSDSDLFTFGYHFKPWTGKPIASREQILDYLGSAIEDADLAPHIRYRQRVQSANWSSDENCWTLQVSSGSEAQSRPIQADFLWMCQGYYQHDRGYTPNWPGLHDFRGEVIHPQHWPETVDLKNRKVVVIGSGATAATLIPALAEQCTKVTMLQRTPTYFAAGRNADALAEELHKLQIDPGWIHEIMRRKAVRDRAVLLEQARKYPDRLKQQLIDGVSACLPDGFDAKRHFTPPYKPLQQRVAFVPEGDLFKAISSGKADVVTDRIKTFDASGIQLESGERIDCDLVVTATGFEMSVMGEIPFSVDGTSVDFAQTIGYRGIMFTGVPNMAWVYGYGFYSWTLRVELIGNFVCRLLRHMQNIAAKSMVPTLRPEDTGMTLSPWVDTDTLNPGYLLRSLDRLPKRGDKPEWQHSQDYQYEKRVLPTVDFSDTIFSYNY